MALAVSMFSRLLPAWRDTLWTAVEVELGFVSLSQLLKYHTMPRLLPFNFETKACFNCMTSQCTAYASCELVFLFHAGSACLLYFSKVHFETHFFLPPFRVS